MLTIMRQFEDMEQKENVDKAGTAWSTQLEGSGGHGNEKVREQRRFHEACDTAGGEAAAQRPRGEGGGTWGEKLENKREKVTKHKQGGFEGKNYPEREDKDRERKELVGSKVVKEFPPFGIFQGVITHIRRKRGAHAQFVYQHGSQHRVVRHMYHVVYQDGDTEDLALSQVLPLLAKASAAQGQARRPRSKPSWTIPTPPPSYGELDDSQLVRHVRVPRRSTLLQIKRLILHAYEDQYTHTEVTLYTRTGVHDEAVCVATDGAAKLNLLKYEQDGHDPGPEGTILLIVSAMNDTESKLLVIPAMHSPPRATVLNHLAVTGAPGHTCDGEVESTWLPWRLATATPSLFDALPLPSHVDDWLAQYREVAQPACEARKVSLAGRNTIYLQPIFCEVAGQQSAPIDVTLFEALGAYIAAFFHCIAVRLLPSLTVHVKKTGVSRGSGKLLGCNVGWRNVCPGNGEAMPHGQLDAGDVVNAIHNALFMRGGMVGGTGARRHRGHIPVEGATGALPVDAFSVLGVTVSDLFCDDDDVFTGGLARRCAGVFSFHRYGGHSSGDEELLLHRACKTATHELMHMFGIGHCVHHHCLMNGCGHLKEDFAAPPFLCPVDLAKLAVALGPRCRLVERYHALLAFCEAQRGRGFGAQSEWLRRALAALGLSQRREGGDLLPPPAVAKSSLDLLLPPPAVASGGAEEGGGSTRRGGGARSTETLLLAAAASGGPEERERQRAAGKRLRAEGGGGGGVGVGGGGGVGVGGGDAGAGGGASACTRRGVEQDPDGQPEDEDLKEALFQSISDYSLPLPQRLEKRIKRDGNTKYIDSSEKCRTKCAATEQRARPFAEPPRTRPRRPLLLSLKTIRSCNPDLEDEQGARAHLCALDGVGDLLAHDGWFEAAPALQALDRVVDALCGTSGDEYDGARMWERESAIPASPRDLQLFTLDTSPEMLAAALFAGFFPFASEFAFPGRPLQERGLINLELAGPEIDWQEGDAGGRLVLDLSESSTDRLTLGKRSIKTVRAAVSNGAAAGVGTGGAGTPYRLTVCAAFERSWRQVVAHHGVDWCGFSAIQAAYRALHEHSPRPWDTVSLNANGRSIPPRVISVELWDTSQADELVSAEIGVIVGRCYVCLSLFSRSNEYPRCDSVRLGASVLWLRRAGVELFDAGTTADYFARHFGYRRCATRRDFAALWRRKRALDLANPRVLSQVCDDVRGLLETYQKQVGGASEVCQMAAAFAAAATQLSTRTPKHTVRISRLSAGVAEAELRAALAQAMPAVIGEAIARLTIAEHLGAAFVTLTDPAHAQVLLSLDGCVLPLTGAPVIQVVAHGRKVKSRGVHMRPEPSVHRI